MIDDEDAEIKYDPGFDEEEPKPEDEPVSVTAICPICDASFHVAWLTMDPWIESTTLSELTEAEWYTVLESGDLEDELPNCRCGTRLEVSYATRAVTIEPASTGLHWIYEGRVPLRVPIGNTWPSAWSPNEGTSLDTALVLELLYLTRDPRLKPVLSRAERDGGNVWTRRGPEEWGCVELMHTEESEWFEETLEAVCPSPPPIELVVAAAERTRNGSTG